MSADESRVVRLCRDLVAIPSVNPDGDPGGADVTGEKNCAEYLGAALERLGAAVTYEEVLPGRPNVIGRFPSRGKTGKPRILLGPHTDTVSVAGMTVPPFGATVRDGRIYGRGACDTKGTMAAMLAALEEIGADRVPDLGAEIVFAGFMGEETGQWGSKHFASHHADEVDFALIGEPTECAAVHTHKGSFWCALITRGKAAHGSRPELGENAILKMTALIDALYEEFVPKLRDDAFDHPVLGKSTLNLGMIRGGVRTNIVPERCSARLDIRFTPAVHRRGVVEMLAEFLRSRGLDPEEALEIDSVCAPLDTPADHPLVRKLADAGEGLAGAPWFCDAAWLAEAGVPAVAAGPGSIAQAHTADEWISIAELEKGVAFYRRFLESL